jgi:hypothetical protein
VEAPSSVFEPGVVVHRLANSLLAAEIALRGLDGGVPKQQRNLLKFAAR